MAVKINLLNIDIPSLTITKDVLKRLSLILEQVSEEAINFLKSEKEPREWEIKRHILNLKIFGDEINIIGNEFKDLEEMEWPESIIRIEMSAEGRQDKKIEINFNFIYPKIKSYNFIKISGQDETWVRGTASVIENILDSCKNNNFLFYSWFQYIYVPIIGYMLFNTIPFIFTPLIIFIINIFNISKPKIEISESIRNLLNYIIFPINNLLGSISFGFLFKSYFIEKIFPFIEFYSEQNLKYKIKRLIIVIITFLSSIKLLYDLYKVLTI